MQMTARQIADLLNGTVEGDPEVLVDRPAKIEEGMAGALSFLANMKYESYIYTTKASVVLVSNGFKPSEPVPTTLVRVADVYGAVAQLFDVFEAANKPKNFKISPLAFIHDAVHLSEPVAVGAYTVLEGGSIVGARTRLFPQVYIGEDVKIGKDVLIYPGVRIYRGCEIGDRCIIHSNAVIGSDGFGFAPNEAGEYQKIQQMGKVIVEDDVEIGANTVIDRATMGATVIRRGAKLDNLIQIAHNVEVGENTVIAAQAGIAGSTKIGDHVQIGGQAGFVGHITVANGTKVQAQSGIARSINEANTAVYGSPALPYTQFLRAYNVFRKLPELQRKVEELEQKLQEHKKP